MSSGYGDFSGVNTAERLVGCILQIVSASTWAYIIGTAAGIAATLDPNAVAFRTTMDQLNLFMKDRKIPTETRHQLREYFEDARELHKAGDDAALLSKMSPLLKGTVAVLASKRWLDQVWFLQGLGEGDSNMARMDREFIAQLAMRFEGADAHSHPKAL